MLLRVLAGPRVVVSAAAATANTTVKPICTQSTSEISFSHVSEHSRALIPVAQLL